jgi:hypothetical protein
MVNRIRDIAGSLCKREDGMKEVRGRGSGTWQAYKEIEGMSGYRGVCLNKKDDARRQENEMKKGKGR